MLVNLHMAELICDNKTLKELGFPSIITYLEKYAVGPTAKQSIQDFLRGKSVL